MNVQTAVAEEKRKSEERLRRAGRSRSLDTQGNGNVTQFPVTLTPSEYFDEKYPGLAAKYGAAVREDINKEGVISIASINEAFFAAILGPEGRPDRPTIRSRVEGCFYQYQVDGPDAGIFKRISDAALNAQISEEFLGCANACRGGKVNTDNLEFRFRDSKVILGILNTAKGQLEVTPDFFQSNGKEYICCANGVLRLSDYTLLSHGPHFRFRNKLAVSFDPEADCAMYRKFLKEALEDEDIDTYQRSMGQALTGQNHAQKILLLVGNAGTGKSTSVKIQQGIIGGENFAMLRTNLLTERFELSRFWGKTILYAPDVSGDFLNHKGAAVLKSLSGDDPMTVEFKNSNESPSMIGNKNVVVTCNSRLVVRLEGDVEAWRRRLVIIPFLKPKPEKVIVDLDRQILEREGSGVLNFMLEGLARLRADEWTLRLTEGQRAAVDNLLLESDAHSLFVKEELIKDEDAQLTAHELFGAYGEFCNSHGWSALPRNKFSAMIGDIVMRQYGKSIRHDVPDPVSGKPQRGWKGLKLRASLAREIRTNDLFYPAGISDEEIQEIYEGATG